jgi:hypothetical protein
MDFSWTKDCNIISAVPSITNDIFNNVPLKDISDPGKPIHQSDFCQSQFSSILAGLWMNVAKLKLDLYYNGKEATVNRALDGSTYPG